MKNDLQINSLNILAKETKVIMTPRTGYRLSVARERCLLKLW